MFWCVDQPLSQALHVHVYMQHLVKDPALSLSATYRKVLGTSLCYKYLLLDLTLFVKVLKPALVCFDPLGIYMKSMDLANCACLEFQIIYAWRITYLIFFLCYTSEIRTPNFWLGAQALTHQANWYPHIRILYKPFSIAQFACLNLLSCVINNALNFLDEIASTFKRLVMATVIFDNDIPVYT